MATPLVRVVLVDSDADHRAALRRLLALMPSVTVVGEFADLSVAIVEAPARHADIAVVEASTIPTFDRLARALADTSILATGPTDSAEFVLRAMRAGAADFLGRPVTAAELTTALEKLVRFRHHAAPARPAGSILSVFATKGGLGATTLATNLGVALARSSSDETLLIEMDSRQSEVTTFLNLRPAYSIVDALRNIERMDESFLRGLLTRHESTLWVLPAPTTVDTGGLPAEHVRTALEIFRAYFARVVLDLRHDWDPATLAALRASDETLVLTSLNVAALRSAAGAIAAFHALGISPAHVRVVLMREDAPEDVTLEQARTVLGMPIAWNVPNDYPAAVAAINRGRPLITEAPRSKVAKNLLRLAATVSGAPRPAVTGATAPTGGALVRHAWRARRLLGVV